MLQLLITPTQLLDPRLSYGILCGQDIFLRIKFSLYKIYLEFENASGVETMVSTGIELGGRGF